MSLLLAIDPGADTGLAIFEDGVLSWCTLCDPRSVPCLEGITDIIVELPEVYSARASKGPAGDLVTLAFRAGMVVGSVREWSPKCDGIVTVKPAAWKGQLTKEVTERRARENLSAIELARVQECLAGTAKGKQHNVWDAVALGLWSLKRFR